ncbi:MAG: hypothetical protein COB07_12670 [Sulfurovum sp.]|nr:MAG: hypothetical protein COB07_12670 [Sulfurovum sp.]
MLKKLKQRKWQKIIKNSGLFDSKYYLFQYPDVRKANVDPIKHYVRFGVDEEKNPSQGFNTSFYLERYKDVNESNINPLAHYILYGKEEGKLQNNDEFSVQIINESGLFDEEYYLSTYPDVSEAGINPIAHYVKFGVEEGRNPSQKFNTLYYLTQYKDVKDSKTNPLVHYIKYGCKEERKAVYIEKKLQKEDFFDFTFTQNNKKSQEYIEYEKKEEIQTDIRLIAFYLPQFYPLKVNDKAWGKGFTEWTNVSKAIPQFEGHYQPRLPGELGYYDLRLIDIQKRQIELAKNYGLHGFCYHYYWFAGKKIMDSPLQKVLDNPELDFPFCINWANENWTKRWDGLDQEVILKQEHSPKDDIAFLEAIQSILTDKRYIKIDGKALLMVYRPQLFPDIKETVKRWRKHAKKIGIGELYLVLSHSFDHQDPREIGFDAATEFAPNNFQVNNLNEEIQTYNSSYEGNAYDYKSAINYSISLKKMEYTKFRSVCPGWDNEARKPGKGTSFINTYPSVYSKWLEFILYDTNNNQTKHEKIIFINAWNEWAEGAYLEPDRKFGYAYLNVTYKQLKKFDSKRLKVLEKTQRELKESDTAVILHLYYADLWSEINEELKNFREPIDLYVNINNNISVHMIEKIINEYPTARFYSYENRGRDIYPFIQAMKIIFPLKYDYVCKIHTKKSLHRTDGDNWRNHLIKSLIGSEERIAEAKQMLKDNVGIVVAKGNIFSSSKWIGSNEKMIKEFARKSNINIPEEFEFPAGSMFWFNPKIMKKLVENFDDSLLPFEDGQIDGTKAHAVERIFGILCLEKLYTIKTI